MWRSDWLRTPNPNGPLQTQTTARTESLVSASLELVSDGMVVGLGGAVCRELIRAICARPKIRVVSNSIAATRAINDHAARGLPTAQLLMIGGTLDAGSTLVGPVAVSAVRKLRTDITFIGASGVDGFSGFTCDSPEEAELLGEFALRTTRSAIAAPQYVIGVTAHWEVDFLSRVNVLVVNDDVAVSQLAGLHRRADVVITAS